MGITVCCVGHKSQPNGGLPLGQCPDRCSELFHEHIAGRPPYLSNSTLCVHGIAVCGGCILISTQLENKIIKIKIKHGIKSFEGL